MREKSALSLLGSVVVLGFASSALANPAGAILQLSTGSATDSQNSPTVSLAQVVWTDVMHPLVGSDNFDIYLLDLATGAPAGNLTNTPAFSPTIDPPFPCRNEFLEDIDAGDVVWSRAPSRHS